MLRPSLPYALSLCSLLASASAQCLVHTHTDYLAGEFDNFGTAVDVVGDTLIITGHRPNDSYGRMLLQTWNGTKWQLELASSSGPGGDDWKHGHQAEIHADVVAFTSPGHPASPPWALGGMAFTWDYKQLLTAGLIRYWASTPTHGAELGHSLSLWSGKVALGAWKDDGAGEDAGAVHVYDRTGQPTTETQLLRAADATPGARFGSAVALRTQWLVVGASAEGSAQPGSIYLYERQGGSFVERQKLLAPAPAAGDRFGAYLSLDGARLAVSAPDAAGGTGRVHLYGLQDGVWVHQFEIAPPPGSQESNFGHDIDLDGQLLIVGAPQEGALDEGAAYLYRERAGQWELASTLLAPEPEADQRFGDSVALDGMRLIVGAPGTDHADLVDSGAAYQYEVRGLLDELAGCPQTLSLGAGGTQELTIRAGSEHAGELYLVLGSLSGTQPGMLLDGFRLPLVQDDYFAHTLLGQPSPLENAQGVLDESGLAKLAFSFVPDELSHLLIGTQVHHAALLFDADSGALSAVTNSVPLLLAL